MPGVRIAIAVLFAILAGFLALLLGAGETGTWLTMVVALAVVLLCLAQYMVILDVSIVNVALPSIHDDLGFSTTGLQWVVNAYTLTFAGFLLLGGRASDLLGRRRVFLAA